MAFLDFLTEGKAPEAVPVSSTSQTVLPDWYTNYAMQLLSNQQALMNRPYTTYEAPRVAPFTALQQQAFSAVPEAAAAYQPALAAATGATAGALGAPGGLTLAQPYINRAGRDLSEMTTQYMNPYTEQVVNRIGQLGARTLREQLMPAIGDKAISAGQFGGTRQAEMIGRALRDVSEGVTAQQAQALQQGYGQAQQTALGELNRQAGLGQTVAGLGAADVTRNLAAAGQLAGLGGQAQQYGLTGVGALQQAGAQQQQLGQQNLDVAYADFLRQQGYQQEQIGKALEAIKGVSPAVPQGQQMAGTQVPSSYQPSTLSTLGQLGLTAAALFG